jgi:ABC-type sugar transport system ATPase subunit
MPAITLEGLSKSYAGGVTALAGVTLDVGDGEWLTVVGPTGCGKTTMLRLIAGLDRPSSGRIRFDGVDVTDRPPHQRNLAMVFQRPALYPHLNVRQNLQFGRGRSRDLGAMHQFAELLQLTDLLERCPHELSGGQQQRVALCKALARQPAILLLDEPFSNLDSRLRREIRRELHLLRGRLPATIIEVTHDQEEALALGDRVAVLANGILQQVDRPDALLQRPANRFVAEFVGWPPMNLLEGRVELGASGLRFVGSGGSLVLPDDFIVVRDRLVLLGLRVEHVHLPRTTAVETVVTLDVRQVERCGLDQLATLSRGEWWLQARCPGSPPLREGAAVEVSLDLTQVCCFDAASGRALFHGNRAAGPC